jgi:NAD(P)H-dependent FMN reductase
MQRLAIIWHSRTGTARQMALAATAGAGDYAVMVKAQDANPATMLTAGGYLFVCPENLASMTGVMKEFFDRCYYPLLGRIEGRPYATAIAAGSDGTAAERQIDRIVTGWRLKRVSDGLVICTGAQTAEAIAAPKRPGPHETGRCRELGAALAEGMRMGIF